MLSDSAHQLHGGTAYAERATRQTIPPQSATALGNMWLSATRETIGPFCDETDGRISIVYDAPGPNRKEYLRVGRRSSLRSCAPAIAMMQATEPGTGDHRRRRRSLAFHGPSIRRVLSERIVNAVIVVGVHVIAHQPPQMGFVQRDDMVEDLAAAASDPALCDSLLPRCLHTRALRLQAGGFQKGDHIVVET